MPSAEGMGYKNGTQELYIRIGQFGFAFLLAWLFVAKIIPIESSFIIILIFFAIAAAIILATHRRHPAQSDYLTTLLQNLGTPLIITLMAIFFVAILIQAPAENIGDLLIYIPPIYIMVLGFEVLR